MSSKIVAQANTSPSGGSKSSDFQPPTRNPQNGPVNTQQGGGGVQQTGDQQLLNNSNATIEVPVNPADSGDQAVAAVRSMNWPAVIIITVIIVVVSEFILRRKEQRKSTPPATEPAEIPEPTAPAEVVITPEAVNDEASEASDQQAAPEKIKKKKSRSKRKRK
jgi:hypothetical protein